MIWNHLPRILQFTDLCAVKEANELCLVLSCSDMTESTGCSPKCLAFKFEYIYMTPKILNRKIKLRCFWKAESCSYLII